MNCLNKFNLICNSQYGFRSNHSTSTALIDLTSKIIGAFENNAYAMGVFLDLSKAFDTINHDILLHKLDYYGIRGISHDWFESYIRNRSQCVKYNHSLSGFNEITHGVPQGSLLGPVLFLLFTSIIFLLHLTYFHSSYMQMTLIFYFRINTFLLYLKMSTSIWCMYVNGWKQTDFLSI